MMKIKRKIFIAEDEKNLRESLKDYFIAKGFEVKSAASVKKSLETLSHFDPDLCLFDIGLEDGSGLDLAQELKRNHHNSKIIFLSALNEAETKLRAFEIGADDYMTKPFDLKELQIRMNRILPEQNERYLLGDIKIDFSKLEVIDSNQKYYVLSILEAKILRHFINNSDEIISRDNIIDLFDDFQIANARSIDNFIVKCRKWLDTDSNQIWKIRTIRGVGYQLSKNKE